MASWVRYSVAVYAGLLFAGAFFITKPEASAVSEFVPPSSAVERSASERSRGVTAAELEKKGHRTDPKRRAMMRDAWEDRCGR